MNPIEVTGVFFFGSLILTSCYLALNKFVKRELRQNWKAIVVLILASIAIKIPYKSSFFDGLEYEDSYIYKASARAIHEGTHDFSNINSYYPTSCIYGSLRDCRMSAIFVTNFLGYPYLINLGYHLFGYHIYVSNIVSLLFSGISVVFVFWAALLMIRALSFALMCSFIYITIPIFNVYASTSLTEPLANVYLMLALLLYLIFVNSSPQEKMRLYTDLLGLLAIAFSMIFSILVKTTNVSLVFCLPAAALISLLCDNRPKNGNPRRRFLLSLPIFLIVFMFSTVVLKFQTAVEINKSDIGVNPFSLSYFKALAPVFAGSFLDFQWYLLYTPLFLAGVFFGLKKKNGTFPILVFGFYFALYTLHYRSYYFTRGLPAVKDDALRYMMSIASVYSILAGFGVYYLWRKIRRFAKDRLIKLYGKASIIALTAIVFAGSLFFTLRCRAYFVEDEQNVRVVPALKTLEYLSQKDGIVLTSEPILFQIYGGPDLKLIDFCTIGIHTPKNEVDSLIRSACIYYLETMPRNSLDEERYRAQYQYLDSKRKMLLFSGEHFEIYWLSEEKR